MQHSKEKESIKYHAEKLLMQFKIFFHNDSQKIIELLRQNKEMTVTEIQNNMSLSQSLLSQRLAKLRTIKVISDYKKSRNVWYHINKSKIDKLEQVVIDYFQLK